LTDLTSLGLRDVVSVRFYLPLLVSVRFYLPLLVSVRFYLPLLVSVRLTHPWLVTLAFLVSRLRQGLLCGVGWSLGSVGFGDGELGSFDRVRLSWVV
jgi:hypothetical protein